MIYAFVVWADISGSTHFWPQGTKDNRIDRVIRRIENHQMDIGVIHTLQVFSNESDANDYADYLHTSAGYEFILSA